MSTRATIPEINVTDLSKRISPQVLAAHIPINGGFDLTYRCNLNCVHCYCNLPAGDKAAATREMPTSEFIRIMDELAAAGTLYLTLTGGEPLLRPDFREIYLYAKRQGFLVTIFTNGTTITPSMADFLAEWPPSMVEITLYGADRATYEKITRVPGSYDRCLAGIRLLKERNVRVSLKAVALTLNKSQLPDIYRLAKEMGAASMFRYDCLIHPRLDGGRGPLAYRVPPTEIPALDLALPELSSALLAYCQHGIPNQASDNLYGCGAGLGLFHIDPYGYLKMCTISEPAYNLRTGRFREGWDQVFPARRAEKLSQKSACYGCTLRSVCTQCPARARLEYDDPHAPIPYFHDVALARIELAHSIPLLSTVGS